MLISFPGDDEAYHRYRIPELMKKQRNTGNTEGLAGSESSKDLMIVKEVQSNVQ